MSWIYTIVLLISGIYLFFMTVFFNEIDLNKYLFLLLFFLILFFPQNNDIFSREITSNMVDYVIMTSPIFKTIFLSRIYANAFFMIVPGLLIHFGAFLVPRLFIQLDIVNYAILLCLIFFLLLFWFLLSTQILLILQFKISDSLICTLLYFGIILSLIFITSFFSTLMGSLKFGSVFIGFISEDNMIISLFSLFVGCSVLSVTLSYSIEHWIVNISKKMERREEDIKHPYSLYNLIGCSNNLNKKDFIFYFVDILCVSIFPFFLDSTFYNNIILRTESFFIIIFQNFITLITINFIIAILYTVIRVLPQVTAEKQFNMEELLLSKISAFKYLKEKCKLLYRPFSVFLLIPVCLFTIFSMFISFILNRPFPLVDYFEILLLLMMILIILVAYFTSLLIFLWRFLPARDLLRSSIITIFGIEILATVISIFFFPPAIIFAIILSSLGLQVIIFDSAVNNSFLFIYGNLANLSLILLFASYILLKADIKFHS